MVSPLKDQPSDKTENNPPFYTKLQKNLFTPDKIYLGKGQSGEVWVTVQKDIKESDKVSGEWVKINFVYFSTDKIERESRYIQIKSFQEIGIDHHLKRFNPSLLLTAYKFFNEYDHIIMNSELNISDFSQFLELLRYEPNFIYELKAVKPSLNENVERANLLQVLAARYTYYDLKSNGLMPDSIINVDDFIRKIGTQDPTNWLTISRLLPTIVQVNIAKEIKEHNLNPKDFISYLFTVSDSVIYTITEGLRQKNPASEQEIINIIRLMPYVEFFQKNGDLMDSLGIASVHELREYFPPGSTIALEVLKVFQRGDIKKFIELYYSVAFPKVYTALEKNGLAPSIDQNTFVKIMNDLHKGNINRWFRVTKGFRYLMNDKVNSIFDLYNVTLTDYMDYLVYHPEEMSDALSELTKLKSDPKNIKHSEVVRMRIDKIASFKGLSRFYSQYIKDHSDQKHWRNFEDFLKFMELADMTYKKLDALEKSKKLEEFFSKVKFDYLDFMQIKRTVPDSTLNFPRYLRYIVAFPESSTLTGFRKLVGENLKLIDDNPIKGKEQLKAFLIEVEKDWLEMQYKNFKCTLVESLFDKTQPGVGKRFVRTNVNDPNTRTQKDVETPFTDVHFVEIMTVARNELEKGNATKVLYLYKESTHLLRTVVVSPLTNRVYILKKGKEVPEAPGRGSYKSVSQAVGIGADNKSEIYANITYPTKVGATSAELQAWREKYKREFGFSSTVTDVSEHTSMKHGRETATAFEKWLVVPDLRIEHVKSFSLKKRLNLLLGVLKDLHAMHESGKIHVDVKPDNMGGVLDNGGNLRGTAFDFGLSTDFGVRSSGGSPAYQSPLMCSQINKGKLATMLPQGDLWSFGLSMYEVLCTPTNPKDSVRPRPTFYTDLEGSARKTKQQIGKVLPNLDQDTVNKSIEQMQLPEGLGDANSAKILPALKTVIQSLLDVTGGVSDKRDLTSKEDIKLIKEEALKLESSLISSLEAIIAALP